MKEKHIILRTPRSATRDMFSGATPAFRESAAAAAGMTLQVDEMDRRDISKLTRDADVVAVAPAMPMKLIEPLNAGANAQPAAGSVEWGIQAVGADTSPFDGDGIVVAVLDTGIDPSHPAFAGVTLVQKNFTAASDDDQNGHGTHCAGTIFGRDTGGTRIGVARGVKMALIG